MVIGDAGTILEKGIIRYFIQCTPFASFVYSFSEQHFLLQMVKVPPARGIPLSGGQPFHNRLFESRTTFDSIQSDIFPRQLLISCPAGGIG